jgi:hypothetical protein
MTMGRCPFGIDIMAKMRQAVELLKARAARLSRRE